MWWRHTRYVSAAEKKRKRLKETQKLEKKRGSLSPVVLESRTITTTFWGKAWCSHFEKMADFENRLPRGRTYARNGSVIHLEILPGKVSALVSGTSLYNIDMTVAPLPPKKWKDIKSKSSGKIANIIDLLKGQFPKDVMDVVCDPNTGLFPLISEIHYNCSCPDWANLCKHIGAVFYGIANRLDTSPELLFTLRQVDPMELLSISSIIDTDLEKDEMGDEDLSTLFGIDIIKGEDLSSSSKKPKKSPLPKQERNVKGTEKHILKKPPKLDLKVLPKPKLNETPKRIGKAEGKNISSSKVAPSPKKVDIDFNVLTGKRLQIMRKEKMLSVAEIARSIGVTPQTFKRWEETDGFLNLKANSLDNLIKWHKKFFN
jgi:uncharacterized Zn finger protein/DNA-binding XRE family transcriptional regulator